MNSTDALRSAEQDARDIAVSSGSAPVAASRLWLGIALAPTAWSIAELAGYILATNLCGGFAAARTLGPLSLATAIHLGLQVTAAAVAVVGLWIALTSLRVARGATDDTRARMRAEFMAVTGVIASALFLTGILMFGMGGGIQQPCQRIR